MPVILERSEESRQRIQDLNILTCVRKLAPIVSQGPALPGQRRSVSLRFRVAMLLKTQFACHRFRGKLTTKEERNYSFYMSKTSKYGNSTQKSVFVPAYIFHFTGEGNKKSPLWGGFLLFLL